jgi:Protein of unknown function (DUF4239)
VVGVVGVFYALIVASVLVIAINHFDRAREVVARESNLIGDVVRDARAISPQVESTVAALAKRYLDEVLTQEWPVQRQGGTTDLGLGTLGELSRSISRHAPADQREAAFYQAMVQKMGTLYDARRDRIFLADEGIASEIWVVILAGGILTVSIVLMFGIEHRRLHFLLASSLAVAIALIFALISFFDTPFQGDISVSDAAYRLIRQQIELNSR